MAPVRRTGERIHQRAPERLLSWLFTGPLGHLYGTLADLAEYGAREARRRRSERRKRVPVSSGGTRRAER